MSNYLDTKIEFLKGVGPNRAETLQKELGVYSFRDLVFLFPFRYVDRTQFHFIKDARTDGDTLQLKGKLVSLERIKGKNNRSRLVGMLKDSSGFMELVWFQGVKILQGTLQEGEEYIVYGKVSIYKGKRTITHPEMELVKNAEKTAVSKAFAPVYSSTEKLDNKGLGGRVRRNLVQSILSKMPANALPEIIPDYILKKLKLCSRIEAIQWIHFPQSEAHKTLAINRLKFEEFFFLQLRMLLSKQIRLAKLKGVEFSKIGTFFNRFFKEKLPFELTGAQKRVLKEIRADVGSGVQMNRLLQGDVGSGKTIVGLMTILIALDNDYQACLVAPTEILAQQHFASIQEEVKGLGIRVGFLSGSVKGKKRNQILQMTRDGDLHILIGTHALFEPTVIFKNMGLAIIDEQHRFGVAQRASLWYKNKQTPPHVLVMTATPIPRTLAMTVYGDLDVSVIDELPPGRKPITTVHKSEAHRAQVVEFMHKEIKKGRQIYVVFPLIEESAKLDLQNLQSGYEALLQYFPKPDFQISVVHGRMKAKDKDLEMQRFVEGKTQIMVATTVIEVGVNVPNASVMIIENTERFGLSQLHQLRGRVGRGAEQSFCILMTSYKLSKEARERISTMVRTNNGFEIAEADLRLRGPGDLEGTRQSGVLDLRLINLVQDTGIMNTARHYAQKILEKDPNLENPLNARLRVHLSKLMKNKKHWGRIS